jgi:hypothetical protein
MNKQFQNILHKINHSEAYFQELELTILQALGSEKFQWNNLQDIKRKSLISDSLNKVRGLIDSSSEIRETVRELNKEYLRLQLSAKSLEDHAIAIIEKADRIKEKLKTENSILFHNFSTNSQDNEIQQIDYKLNRAYGLDLIPEKTENQEQESFEYKVF